MIHYFNPGHEAAVLNGSTFYRPPAKVLKMQEDLALLPTWYASPGDYVLFSCPGQHAVWNDKKENLQNQRVDLWGISPHSIYLFEKLSRHYNLQLKIPEWKAEFRLLGSRFISHKVLSLLMDEITEIEKDILPQFFSGIDEIDRILSQSNEKYLIKSPFSSSGRGLIWLPPGKIARSEKQNITGMLKKQSQVSVEKALDKQLDFSMHFENTPEGETHFIGYSIFRTNAKGAYEKSILANQETLEKQITTFIDRDLLLRVKKTLISLIHKTYSNYYQGNIGVDMLIYKSGDQYKLNPCVEINMRKSMGYLAIRLFENYIYPDSICELVIAYDSFPQLILQRHKEWKKQYPLVFEDKRIKNGYLNLCPVTETVNYYAYVCAKS
ncbi:MAG: hypothetical protein LBP83_05790 [Dysgonamonadaceae bacterium]|jgi:hypothetical protein|nr:hypothetical protein [Dysgonamonadaceae bacterium]